MKGWIELDVLCKTEESEVKQKCNLEVKDDDFKYQPYMLQISQIGAIGKAIHTGGSFIEVSGCSMQSKQSPEQIFELIKNDFWHIGAQKN